MTGKTDPGEGDSITHSEQTPEQERQLILALSQELAQSDVTLPRHEEVADALPTATRIVQLLLVGAVHVLPDSELSDVTVAPDSDFHRGSMEEYVLTVFQRDRTLATIHVTRRDVTVRISAEVRDELLSTRDATEDNQTRRLCFAAVVSVQAALLREKEGLP